MLAVSHTVDINTVSSCSPRSGATVTHYCEAMPGKGIQAGFRQGSLQTLFLLGVMPSLRLSEVSTALATFQSVRRYESDAGSRSECTQDLSMTCGRYYVRFSAPEATYMHINACVKQRVDFRIYFHCLFWQARLTFCIYLAIHVYHLHYGTQWEMVLGTMYLVPFIFYHFCRELKLV